MRLKQQTTLIPHSVKQNKHILDSPTRIHRVDLNHTNKHENKPLLANTRLYRRVVCVIPSTNHEYFGGVIFLGFSAKKRFLGFSDRLFFWASGETHVILDCACDFLRITSSVDDFWNFESLLQLWMFHDNLMPAIE